MKILAIRGKNLASLEGEFEIDFRKEPLCSAGIFAITGPTGSGKSTILDAMCIALYGATPRLENIKNSVAIETHGSSSLSENHINTILRRGKCDGYAEVEFKAVNGNEYRVRWSVARTGNNPNGNFKKTSYDITNLGTGEHTSPSIKEHKELLPKLTGLTFEQFTRAVLLAQGNFAAFLKAEEKEKATILQTLTGTEIYSRISEIIYRRNDEAQKELALIEEKKRGLVIMSDEDVALLNENRKKLLAKQDVTNKELQTLVTKKNWLERMEQLLQMLEISDNELNSAKQALKDATPRAEWLKRIDSVQEIRDKYTSLCNSETFCSNSEKEILQINENLNSTNIELAKANECTANATAQQEQINKEWLEVQPRIMQAVKLEEQKENEAKREKDLTSEKERLQKEYNDNRTKRNSTINEINTLVKEQERISEWYAQHQCYETVIPYIPSIIACMAAARDELKFAEAKNKQLANAEKMLGTNIQRFECTNKRKEELEQTLPSEIASLRKQLVEGIPCPVCGSRHHEVTNEVLNILEEKELEKEKKEVQQQLEYLEKAIEGGKTEIAGLKTAIEMHHSSADTNKERCIGYLQGIDNAQELFQKDDIATFLNEIKNCWDKNRAIEAKITEQLAIDKNNIVVLDARSNELANEISAKQQLIDEIKRRLEKCREEIEIILGGNTPAKTILEHHNRQMENANKAVAVAMEKKMTIAESCNRLNGQLAEKKNSLAEEQKRCMLLLQEINDYIAKRDDKLSIEELKELLSQNQATIVTLRKEMEKLNNAVATATATRSERERSIGEHKQATVRPEENENLETLKSAIEKINEQNREIIEEVGNINAVLLKNEENCQKFAQYKEEYKAKQTFAKEIGTLNTMFGSATGDKLMKLAQGYTLEILLDVANVHLKEITGRYELARISDKNLGIKIVDLDMLSETRSVHSLSGGETFLVSLALSLALSSISSNRMSIESLFIDEGFGALDNNTLKIAMHALERLQSQGRTIGVISHCVDMLEQIPVKISVTKKNSGRSKIEVKEG